MSPILIAACERAWAALTADLTLLETEAAAAQGLNPRNLNTWIARHHYGELVALRSRAGLPRYGSKRAVEEICTPEKSARLDAAMRGFISGKYATVFIAAAQHKVTSTELYRFINLQRKRNSAELPARKAAA